MTYWDDEQFDESYQQESTNFDDSDDEEVSPEEAAFMQGYEEADEIDTPHEDKDDE